MSTTKEVKAEYEYIKSDLLEGCEIALHHFENNHSKTHRVIIKILSDAIANAPKELSASEALFGFTGWLTARNKRVVASAHDDAAVWAELVKEFCERNNLTEPRENWHKNLTNPPFFSPPGDQ